MLSQTDGWWCLKGWGIAMVTSLSTHRGDRVGLEIEMDWVMVGFQSKAFYYTVLEGENAAITLTQAYFFLATYNKYNCKKVGLFALALCLLKWCVGENRIRCRGHSATAHTILVPCSFLSSSLSPSDALF